MINNTSRIDWAERALQSEIAFSEALGGQATEYNNFIHIHNESVSWGGDFNRAVGLRISDGKSFFHVIQRVEAIHSEMDLDRPDRYDILPPALDKDVWTKLLAKRGHTLCTVFVFCASILVEELSSDYSMYTPNDDEYLDWYQSQESMKEYYEEAWFQLIKPLRLKFIQQFKPYWLMKDGLRVAWVYCANLGAFDRLSDVGVEKTYRGYGLGKLLLEAIRIEAGRQGSEHVLLQSSEGMRAFYEKSGFTECTRNSVIRLTQR